MMAPDIFTIVPEMLFLLFGLLYVTDIWSIRAQNIKSMTATQKSWIMLSVIVVVLQSTTRGRSSQPEG